MWRSLWRSSDRFSLQNFKYVINELQQIKVVNKHNRELVVDLLQSIVEIVTYGDRQDPYIFECFMEFQVLAEFVRVLKISSNSRIEAPLLQYLSIMIQNMNNEQAIYYCLSNGYINSIITHPYEFNGGDLASYYVSFLRAVSSKVNKDTLCLLVKVQGDAVVSFPLYSEALKFSCYGEKMIQTAICALTLNIYSVADDMVSKFVTTPPASEYFSELVYSFRELCFHLDSLVCSVEEKCAHKREEIVLQTDKIVDDLYYFKDIFSVGDPHLNKLVNHNLLKLLIFPALLPLLQSSWSNGSTLSATTSLYIFSLLLQVVGGKFMINSIASILLYPYIMLSMRDATQGDTADGCSHLDCFRNLLNGLEIMGCPDPESREAESRKGSDIFEHMPENISSNSYFLKDFGDDNLCIESCGLLAYVYSENRSILLASLFLLLILAESKDLEYYLASVIGSRYMQGLMSCDNSVPPIADGGILTRCMPQVLNALLTSLACQPPYPALVQMQTGWFLRKLLLHVKTVDDHSLHLFSTSYEQSRQRLQKELDGCWYDHILDSMTKEWASCKAVLEEQCQYKDPFFVLEVAICESITEDDTNSYFAWERMVDAVKVFILHLQLKAVILKGNLLEESFLKLMNSPKIESGRTHASNLLCASFGSDVSLGSGIPCKIAFSNERIKDLYFIPVASEVSGRLILAEKHPFRSHRGVVIAIAPLAGLNPNIDEDHPTWLHLRIREFDPRFDSSKNRRHSSKTAHPAADGRWTLGFPSAKACEAARLLILEETWKHRSFIESILAPLLQSNCLETFANNEGNMRAGGCTVQQALTPEAASLVKQAVTLARRRGHAQVTPLHVANTMLAASTGLLRTACLQSHSHPLQCKALELCFNVALNRLPASTSTPILSPHHSQYPSISNALVAAFKRAQAHQRRGSIENQQQPLLAVKIELEQLIISILDDPSVSRVMREAGFSSTQVKSNVEQAVSLEISSQTAPSVTNSKPKESNNGQAQAGLSKPKASDDSVRNEDIRHVINSLMNKRRRNFVIVGECISTIEGVIRGVAEKFDKGDVPEGLREVKFITLSLSSLGHLSRAEIEQKLQELKSLVRGCLGREIILNLGDLAWATEYKASSVSDEQARGCYSPVEHVIMDLSKLACGVGETGRFWLLGIATFQTYMRCKSGYPSLEAIWGLHPITIPVGSLSLSLITDSEIQSQSRNKKAENGVEEESQLSCCADCSANFKIDADRSLQSSDDSTSNLPAWLRKYKDEQKAVCSSRDKDTVQIKDLCKKWNLICNSIHKSPYPSDKTLTFNSSVSPSSSTSGFSYEQQTLNLHHMNQEWPVIEPRDSWNKDRHFWVSETLITHHNPVEPSLRLYTTDHHHQHPSNIPQTPFSSNPNSASSSDVMEMEYIQRFKELNIENLTTLCTALESKVPWQKDIIPEIASTILRCRSGMARRKRNKVRDKHGEAKEESWLFFQGVDVEGKEKIAKELARLVFGSQNAIVSIALSSFSSTRADSIEDCRNKRSRDEQSCSYIERFAEAVCSNPHRVFLVEDVEQADYCSQIGFKRAIERGRISNSNGGDICLADAIVILSCESFSSRSRACSPPVEQKSDEEQAKMDQQTVSLDLNLSIDDESMDQDVESIDDIGLLESVDRCIVFRIQEL